MSIDRSRFDAASSLADLQNWEREATSTDGEYAWLELKGVDGTTWSKETKALIAKEICAFANTYGGVVCLHGVGGLQNPVPTDLLNLTDQLEGVLVNSLEPRLAGIDLKACDDRVLIYVPESRVKPHRTALKTKLGKQYFYRHVTASEPMEEVMIRALYQAQGILVPRLVGVVRPGGQQQVSILVLNDSRLVGTKPRVQYEILFVPTGPGPNSYHFIGGDFEKCRASEPRLGSFHEIRPDKSDGMRHDIGQTATTFQDEILYPSSHLTAATGRNEYRDIGRHILLRSTAWFAEAPAATQIALIDLENADQKETGADEALPQLWAKFIQRIQRDGTSG